jgi:hypothetical protein
VEGRGAITTSLFATSSVTQPSDDGAERSASVPKNVDKKRSSETPSPNELTPTAIPTIDDIEDDLDVSDWSVHELAK